MQSVNLGYMRTLIIFALICHLMCNVVDYWYVVAPTFIQKFCYAQAWSLVWQDALGAQLVAALSISSFWLVSSLKLSDCA